MYIRSQLATYTLSVLTHNHTTACKQCTHTCWHASYVHVKFMRTLMYMHHNMHMHPKQRTFMRVRMCTSSYPYYVCFHENKCASTWMHIVHSYVYIPILTFKRTPTHSYIHAYMHTYTHTILMHILCATTIHIHTCIHTYTIYKHTHTLTNSDTIHVLRHSSRHAE
jgi:hypothetical protein